MIKLISELKNTLNTKSESIAYINRNESITYGELYQKADRLARALSAQGTKPVVIYGKKSVDMYASLVACLLARRAYVPVEAGTPEERLSKIIDLSGADIIIANEPVNHPLSNSPDEIINLYSGKNSLESNNTTAYIIFTSGSTGEPKGVPVSYENLDNFIHWLNSSKPLKDGKIQRVLNRAPFCFDLSVADIYYSLSNGCTLAALDTNCTENYTETFRFIRETGIQLMVATPSFCKLLLLDEQFTCKSLPELSFFWFCGERLEISTAKKLRNRFPGAHIINAYGPTEATCAVCAIEISEEMLQEEYLPVGEAKTAACEIIAENGEIVLKGRSVFGGYLGFDSETCFKENGINCYKTGDTGYIENGLVYCRGRMDGQIKYMGYRIELGDIESNLLKLNEVEHAAVVAKTTADGQSIRLIKAFVTLNENISAAEIKAELAKILPHYMVPKTVVILEEMPLNNNGKIDRKRLNVL